MAATAARPETASQPALTAPGLDRRPPASPRHLTAWARATARGLQHVEWLLLAAAAPLLLFPGRGRDVWLGLTLIGGTWLARRVGSGHWSIRTPVDRYVVVLLLTAGVSLVPSIRLDYSLPKFWGLLLGLAALYAVVNTCGSQRSLRLFGCGLLAAGASLAAFGFVAMANPPDKLIDDHGLYAALPRVLTSIQSSTVVSQGINPNELGGVLVLLAPLSFVLAGRGGWLRLPALATAGLITTALVLSQSRAALLGLLVSACTGASVAFGRRGLLVVTVLLVAGGQALIQVEGLDHLRQQLLGDAPSAGVESLASRVELWQRGLAMALDMPLTGIGLNTFPVLLPAFYPTILHTADASVPHVHDLYLQTLLDFGIFGLSGWLAIVVVSVGCGLAAVRSNVNRALAVGLLLGLLAHAIYSLVDAVTLGAKPGALLWVILGGLLVLGRSASRPAAGLEANQPRPPGCGAPMHPPGPVQGRPSRGGGWSHLPAISDAACAPMRAAGPAPAEPRLDEPSRFHDPQASPRTAARRWPCVVCSPLVGIVLALLVAPVLLVGAALNAANVLLHRAPPLDSTWTLDADPGTGRALGVRSAFLDGALEFAGTLAVGPFAARVDAARSLVAHERGDASAELVSLASAQSLGNWDSSLGLRLGDLRLETGDRRGAVLAWRAANAMPVLLARATAPPADRALGWFSLAQSVDAGDWRPYAGAAHLLETRDPHRAAGLLSEALRLRGEDAARAAIARRLVDPSAPLPPDLAIRESVADADLLNTAARLLLARNDLAGGQLATHLASTAAPRPQQSRPAAGNPASAPGSPP